MVYLHVFTCEYVFGNIHAYVHVYRYVHDYTQYSFYIHIQM